MTVVESAQVVVVGGGPAGSVTATALARRGRDVLLLDRHTFPRPKACGECLNPGAVRVLGRMGLLRHVCETGPPSLRGWTLVSPGGRRVFARFPGNVRALGVDRHTFDAALFAEARDSGVRTFEGFRVTRVESGAAGSPARAWGRTADGTPFRVKGSVLVGADGLRSVVARGVGAAGPRGGRMKASLTWRLEGRGPDRDRGRLYVGGGRTVGLAPVPASPRAVRGEGLWNASIVVASGPDRTGLRQKGEGFLRGGLEALDPGWDRGFRLVDGPWASGSFLQPVRTPVVGRVVLVGDAAGYYDPLTGQGMFRALRSAELAAHAIDHALPQSSSSRNAGRERRDPGVEPVVRAPLDRYRREHTHAFRPGRVVQRIIDGVVSRSRVREPVFAFLERSPGAASALVGLIGDVGIPVVGIETTPSFRGSRRCGP